MEFSAEDRDTHNVIDMTTSEKVVDLLNQAALIPTDAKLAVLKQVQELIINKDPSLLDNFLDEIIAFQTDKSIEVRKFVIGFIEEACKRDNELLLRLIANLNMLLKDDSVNVVKKAILTLTQMYKVTLQWLVRAKAVSDMQEACWEMVTQMKGDVLALLDSENDGVRTHAIKFTESLIVTLSPRMVDSDVPKRQESDISLDKVPKDHAYIRYDVLCEEGKSALDKLLKFMVHPAISSINLTTALGSLATIARQRPMFMSKVVQAYETLHGLIVGSLLLCWFPNQVRRLMMAGTPKSRWSAAYLRGYVALHPVADTFFYLSSALNPFLYNVSSRHFRQVFVQVLRCRLSVQHVNKRTVPSSGARSVRSLQPLLLKSLRPSKRMRPGVAKEETSREQSDSGARAPPENKDSDSTTQTGVLSATEA